MSARATVLWMFAAAAFCAIATGPVGARGTVRSAAAAASHIRVLDTPEPPSPTVTPLPPPIVPPPDAAGNAHTTPPFDVPSPAPSPSVADALWLSASNASTVPIEMHGGRPFVPVVVDGVRHDFLVSSELPTALDEALMPAAAVRGGVVRTLQIGDVRLTNVSVRGSRVTAFSQTYLGAAAGGILGRELFARYPVAIDYPNRSLTIYRSPAAEATSRPATAVVTPLRILQGAPAVECAIDGRDASPCIVDVYQDSVAMVSGNGWNTKGARSTVMRDAEPGREMHGVTMRARSLTVGPLSIGGPLVDVFAANASTSTALASRDPDALRTTIGSGAFSRYAITIDEPGGTFAASQSVPEAAAPPPFDGSGLWLVWRGGQVVVRSVMRRSPCELAGLQSGDAIVAIDGQPVQDLDQARAALLQPTGTHVIIDYQRGTRHLVAAITLRSPI